MFSNALFRLSMSRFLQKIFAIKYRSRRKTEHIFKFLDPDLLGGTTQTFLRQFLVRFTVHRLAKFADLRLRSLAMKQNAEFTEGG